MIEYYNILYHIMLYYFISWRALLSFLMKEALDDVLYLQVERKPSEAKNTLPSRPESDEEELRKN